MAGSQREMSVDGMMDVVFGVFGVAESKDAWGYRRGRPKLERRGRGVSVSYPVMWKNVPDGPVRWWNLTGWHGTEDECLKEALTWVGAVVSVYLPGDREGFGSWEEAALWLDSNGLMDRKGEFPE